MFGLRKLISAARRRVREDVAAVRDRDPAAKSTVAVLTCYPGLHALWAYRVAHLLWTADHHLAARLLSQAARLLTGVEIHPAAEVGRRVVIDHGIGVVVGSTAKIGDDVLVYHGVTLGNDVPRDGKRHPTVGDDVMLGAHATLLGPIEVGDGATVGGAAVVVDSVPADATVVGNPARIADPGEALSLDTPDDYAPHDRVVCDGSGCDGDDEADERHGFLG
ncbi:MAG: serine O-acetyltransferase [Haloplanus sp.]